MKVYQWMLVLLFTLCVSGTFPIPVYSSEPKDSNRQALSDLLTELEQKIKDADKRMIAHPKFLKELQSLVDKFRGRLRQVFLKEDFLDGDYTNNPKWHIVSGQFEITPSHRLLSRVYVERPVVKPSSKKKSDLLEIILKEMIKSKEEEKTTVRETKEALISTRALIGPVFEVDIVMVSQSRWGSMEVLLLGGKQGVPRYRMVYNAASSAERPIQIIRERDSRRYLIEAATKYPSLDDGVPHRIKWIRDSKGQMRVLVDGKEVLSTVEVFYRKNFSGIALVNRGGTYEWGPIQIIEASRE